MPASTRRKSGRGTGSRTLTARRPGCEELAAVSPFRHRTTQRRRSWTHNGLPPRPAAPLTRHAGWAESTDRRDAASLADCYTDDSRYEDLTLGQVLQGRQNLDSFTEAWLAASSDLHVELGRCFVSGDDGAMPSTMTGTLTGRSFAGL
ncbi:nuclear transport factor 2 family protein [Streptomyces sp. NPDC048718]|uniref:nuclear transport factor 2 family protein n=1 Tax=Streptomyces sp. NPDC048718 TaxID=3365587 RepID=UPI003711C519